ncbi:MAG: capsular biosynthesis protein [Pseudomonadota bacterium]|nr:capsular biosynthesis protein [Pseudomonadota bacterium]
MQLHADIPDLVDIHCHLLPSIDDGAQDLQAGLGLARAAVLGGIRTAILTPHVFPGRFDNRLENLQPVFESFRKAIDSAGIGLTVHLGGEVHLTPESLEMAADGRAPMLGGWQGSKVMLLEFPDGHIPVGALNAVRWLMRAGIVPMIAHPERNKAVMRSVDAIEPFVREGCLLQLTAASVCGWFGPRAHDTAHELLRREQVTAVATDAHNLRYRPPVLIDAWSALRDTYGDELATRLCAVNPATIIAGRVALGLDT